MTLAPGLEASRGAPLRSALRLEYLSLGWNVVEAVVALLLAAAAASVALYGFGLDSVIESLSAGVLVWRLRAELHDGLGANVERIERVAHRLVGASLIVLAVYVAGEAVLSLWRADRPEPSLGGVVLTSLSLAVMMWLARAKRRLAIRLGSRSLEADAFQTTACWWLSLSALVGLGLNAVIGWWWADPVAALVMCVFITREGVDAWRGRGCGCEVPTEPAPGR